MVRKKKINNENLGRIDHSQSGASHIKSDSSESFKEVSFNVLENAVERRNSLFGYKNRDFNNKAIISSDEMLPTKVKRKSLSKISISLFLTILILVLITVAGYYFINNDYLLKIDHSSPLKEAIFKIGDYDNELFALNSFLQNTINEKKVKQTSIDKDKYKQISNDLKDLSEQINDISKDIDPQSDDFLYAGYAKQTIESRQMMIDTGLKIYDSVVSSVETISEAEKIWSSVLKADATLKESDNLVQSNDADNYSVAKNKSDDAVKGLTDAQNNMSVLVKKFPDLNFKIYENYIQLRLDSAKISSAACQALMEQNLDLITSLNKSYIEKSNQSSDIALSMSTTPVQVLRTNYDVKTRPLIEEFKAARKNSADYDYALREFLVSE